MRGLYLWYAIIGSLVAIPLCIHSFKLNCIAYKKTKDKIEIFKMIRDIIFIIGFIIIIIGVLKND